MKCRYIYGSIHIFNMPMIKQNNRKKSSLWDAVCSTNTVIEIYQTASVTIPNDHFRWPIILKISRAQQWYCYALCKISKQLCNRKITQIAKFMGPAWGPPGSCWPQIDPMLAPWTLIVIREIMGTQAFAKYKFNLCFGGKYILCCISHWDAIPAILRKHLWASPVSVATQSGIDNSRLLAQGWDPAGEPLVWANTGVILH